MAGTESSNMKTSIDAVLIAHRIYAHETFEETAQILLRLLNRAQRQFPNAERTLRLEIDGHLNPNGGFDDDMYELLSKFMVEVLIKFLTRAETPFGGIQNLKPQDNSIPKELNLVRVDGSHTA
jgi:hypothetical protein